MRLALIIYGSLHTLSGGYVYDRKLVDTLQRQGHQVEILSLPWRNYASHLGDNRSPALFEHLQRLEADLLLQDELNHPSLFWLNRRLQGRVRYPIISIVHHLRSSEIHPPLEKRLYRWVERRYLAGVDGFVFNSQTTRQVVENLVGHGVPKIVAYPGADRLNPGIREEEIARRATQSGPLRLFFLGNLIPRKRVETLLEAMRQLPKELCSLTIAGSLEVDARYTRQIQKQVAENRLEDRVSFRGVLEDSELRELLRASHILVVPSSYEGFGIVYLEGMGFGLPAIGTTAGGAGEIITPGEDGFLINPGNAGALARYLQELFRNRLRLQEMSLAAHRRYLKHPTWEQSGERIRDFLLQVIDQSPKRANRRPIND